MEFALNNSPELTMSEITKKLFNNNFLCDIQFNIETQVICGHALELMKRSIVFEKEFEAKIDKPYVIRIENFTYTSFYEFIRFIYTDKCEVNLENIVELYRLATKYKVVKLENQLLDFLLQGTTIPLTTYLSFYGFCVTENWVLPYNVIRNAIGRHLKTVMALDEFTRMQPIVMADLLKMDCVDKNVKEVQLFNGLMHWMDSFCLSNDIGITQRLEKFATLLQSIRYSTMSMEEFRGILLKYSDLFKDEDIGKCLKDQAPRNESLRNCERKAIMWARTTSETKFLVSKEVIFTGFRYGAGGNQEIKITSNELSSNEAAFIALNMKSKSESAYKTISLGETLVLKPNTEYSVQINYDNGGYSNWCVTYRLNEIVIHDPSKAVEILNPGSTMFEIFFKAMPIETSDVPTKAKKSLYRSKSAETVTKLETVETKTGQNIEAVWSEICKNKVATSENQPSISANVSKYLPKNRTETSKSETVLNPCWLQLKATIAPLPSFGPKSTALMLIEPNKGICSEIFKATTCPTQPSTSAHVDKCLTKSQVETVKSETNSKSFCLEIETATTTEPTKKQPPLIVSHKGLVKNQVETAKFETTSKSFCLQFEPATTITEPSLTAPPSATVPIQSSIEPQTEIIQIENGQNIKITYPETSSEESLCEL